MPNLLKDAGVVQPLEQLQQRDEQARAHSGANCATGTGPTNFWGPKFLYTIYALSVACRSNYAPLVSYQWHARLNVRH